MSGSADYNKIFESEKSKVRLLCLDLSGFSQTVQFLTCSAAVFLFFLLYGYMQELIFTLEGFQPYGWFLTLVQFGFYSIFGLVETYTTNVKSRK